MYECGGHGWALAAAGCLVSGHVDVGGSCKAERGLLLAATLFANARFIARCDDDVFWSLRPLHSFLASVDARTKTAFGYFNCGERRGMDFKCVSEQRVVPLRRWLPKCFPVYAIMSRAAIDAITPFLEFSYFQVVARQLHTRDDTALGIALWLAGVRYSEALVPYSNEVEACASLPATTLRHRSRCVAVHVHHFILERFHIGFDETYRRLAEADAARTPRMLNISGSTFCRQASIMFQSIVNSSTATDISFLRDCLLLELAPEPWASFIRAPPSPILRQSSAPQLPASGLSARLQLHRSRTVSRGWDGR